MRSKARKGTVIGMSDYCKTCKRELSAGLARRYGNYCRRCRDEIAKELSRFADSGDRDV